MHFYAHEKLALLIDGPNFHYAMKGLGLDVDWGLLQGFFARQSTLVNSIYLTPLPAEQEDGFQPLRRFLDWLDYNGWSVITRDKDTDVALAVMAMELASNVDHFVIATGDSDFAPLTEALQRQGCRVTILHSLKTGMLSDELRRAANSFFEVDALREHITRAPKTVKEAATA